MFYQLVLLSVCFLQINSLQEHLELIEFHTSCRNSSYPGTHGEVLRAIVADQEVSWENPPIHQPYDPPTYTSKIVLDNPEWADPDMKTLLLTVNPKWNRFDIYSNITDYDRVDRCYRYFVNHSYPLNPVGRTGLKGRGLLGRWGPNHQVHVVVARKKRDKNNQFIKIKEKRRNAKFEMEFISVKRKTSKLWSVPGRFFDENKEDLGAVLKKCLIEDIFNNFTNHNSSEKKLIKKRINYLFRDGGNTIYLGYMDDPRNTDNAWISTRAFLFFDSRNLITRNFTLKPGKDILDVKWVDGTYPFYNKFYGGHRHLIKLAAKEKNNYYPLTSAEQLKRLRKWESSFEVNKRRILEHIKRLKVTLYAQKRRELKKEMEMKKLNTTNQEDETK